MTNDALQAVNRFYRALAEGDAASATALAAPSIVVTQTDELPWGGRFEGLAAFARFGESVRRHIASTVSIERMFAAGDQVVVTGQTTGTALATGTAFDLPLVHLFTFAGGRIVALHVAIDTPAMQRALADAAPRV